MSKRKGRFTDDCRPYIENKTEVKTRTYKDGTVEKSTSVKSSTLDCPPGKSKPTKPRPEPTKKPIAYNDAAYNDAYDAYKDGGRYYAYQGEPLPVAEPLSVPVTDTLPTYLEESVVEFFV